MGLAMLWAVVLVWWGQGQPGPGAPLLEDLVRAFLPGGLVLAAMIGRLAQRRFFDAAIIDGDAFRPGSGADIDQRVLSNTMEQMMVALCVWPFAGQVLGADLLLPLGVSFAVTRVMFWIGYHASPPLRGLGFAGTFYPTVVAGVWALAVGL
jgi:hypothetical protein